MIGRLARPYAAEAIAALVLAVRTGDLRTKVVAAQELLNRGFGRPHTSDGKPPDPQGLTDAELDTELRAFVKELEAAGIVKATLSDPIPEDRG